MSRLLIVSDFINSPQSSIQYFTEDKTVPLVFVKAQIASVLSHNITFHTRVHGQTNVCFYH